MLLAISDKSTSPRNRLGARVADVRPRVPILLSQEQAPSPNRVRAFEKQTILAELKRNNNQISNTGPGIGTGTIATFYKKAELCGN